MEKGKDLVLTSLITFIVTFVILSCASRVFIPKWITHEDNMMSYIIKGFYEEDKNSLDVLFMGNSDVYRGISPMEIYQKTGITSYNFVSAGQRMWIAYTMLEEALRLQKPKVIFFNVDELFFTSQSDGAAHKVYDNLNWGLPKIKGVFDKNYENKGKLSHFFPIFAYHDRYKALTTDDFKYAFYDYSNPTKGMDLVAYQEPYTSDLDYMQNKNEEDPVPDKTKDYLLKMKNLCEKKGVEFVLIELPSPDSWTYARSSAVEVVAFENDLTFIDLNKTDIGIDWSKDTSDGGDHLNIYGAEKVSSYLASYLKDHFSFEKKSEKIKKQWDDDYQTYLKIKEKEIDAV